MYGESSKNSQLFYYYSWTLWVLYVTSNPLSLCGFIHKWQLLVLLEWICVPIQEVLQIWNLQLGHQITTLRIYNPNSDTFWQWNPICLYLLHVYLLHWVLVHIHSPYLRLYQRYLCLCLPRNTDLLSLSTHWDYYLWRTLNYYAPICHIRTKLTL